MFCGLQNYQFSWLENCLGFLRFPVLAFFYRFFSIFFVISFCVSYIHFCTKWSTPLSEIIFYRNLVLMLNDIPLWTNFSFMMNSSWVVIAWLFAHNFAIYYNELVRFFIVFFCDFINRFSHKMKYPFKQNRR